MQLKNNWKEVLKEEFTKTYFSELLHFLKEEEKNFSIFPQKDLVLNALHQTDFPDVKVVLLGQDPYHGLYQAHGLSFSVQQGCKIPPSLKNIFKELSQDIDGFVSPTWGDLTNWANQGVLLLNTTLTVRKGEPASHQNRGWEIFTDKIIVELSRQRRHLVFMLWGKHAQEKLPLINKEKHLVLKAPHPSPFSARTGFLGCKHFSKANAYLFETGQIPIDWKLPLKPSLF